MVIRPELPKEDTMSAAASEKQTDETRRIEQALDALLGAIDQHDAWCERACLRRDLKPISLAELLAKEFSPVEALLEGDQPKCIVLL